MRLPALPLSALGIVRDGVVRPHAGQARIPLDYLPPRARVLAYIALEVTALPGETPRVILGDQVRALTPGQAVAVWTWADHDVELRLEGIATARRAYLALPRYAPPPGQPWPPQRWVSGIELELDGPEPRPIPADILGLDAHLPVPSTRGGNFDRSRFDRDTFDAPQPHWLAARFDRDRWDTATWPTPALERAWASILPAVRTIQVERGYGQHALAACPEVGTLTITAVGTLDPRATGLVPGTPVRLYHVPTRQPIFTGVITNLAVTPAMPGSPAQTVITAADLVADLAAITRYGARSSAPDGAEPLSDRIDRLLESSPHRARIRYPGLGPLFIRVPPTVWETNLAAHLDAVTAPYGGAWRVTRDGTLEIVHPRPPLTGPPLAVISDASTAALSPSAVTADWSTAGEIAAVKLENHPAKPDTQASHGWVADDATVVATGPNRAIGGGEITLQTVAYPHQATELARRLLRTAHDAPPVRAATIPISHPRLADARARDLAARAATLEPLDALSVEYRGETHRARISHISHTITPTSWEMEIQIGAE